MSKSILISCPIRNRDWVLPYYLKSLYELDYPKKSINILWVVNQSTDKTERLLREFKFKYESEYKSITIKTYNGKKAVPNDGRIRSARSKFIYSHLAELRNYIVERIGENDYLFSSDSDIILRPDTLKRLVGANKDMVSSLIYNGYLLHDQAWKFPNVLRIMGDGKIEHIANKSIKDAPSMTKQCLIKVDVTGASILISRSAAKIIKYGYHIQGEDVYMGLDAKNKRLELWCDIGLFNQHIMSREMLEHYKATRELGNEKKGDTLSPHLKLGLFKAKTTANL